MRCHWCKGRGTLHLSGYGVRVCLNCHGTGKGVDGGDKPISYARKPWAIGNSYGKRRIQDGNGVKLQ
jgi:hypothetical protein